MAKIKLTTLILALFLLLIYWTPRLYQFPQRLALRYDQGLHLLESWEMVQSGKLRLIGPMGYFQSFWMAAIFFIGPHILLSLGSGRDSGPLESAPNNICLRSYRLFSHCLFLPLAQKKCTVLFPPS